MLVAAVVVLAALVAVLLAAVWVAAGILAKPWNTGRAVSRSPGRRRPRDA